MKRRKRFLGGTNNGFVCENCGCKVRPLTKGGYRNHCPHCLYSKHVDINPGDRTSECSGLMKPMGIFLTSKKGWVITHRCIKCGFVRRNKAALNDSVQPDDFDELIRVSLRS